MRHSKAAKAAARWAAAVVLALGLALTTPVATLLKGGSAMVYAEASASETGKPRKSVEISIYNDDLALVRDVRTITIPLGTSNLTFTDIAAMVDPSSVSFTSLTSPGLVKVLEQNYEFDLVSDYELLRKYAGEKVRVITRDGTLYEGYVLNAFGGGDQRSLVLGERPDGGRVWSVLYQDMRVVEFPELPQGLMTKPSFVWMVQNDSGESNQTVEVSYLTSGISWRADYVAVINEADNAISLTGWVTVDNKSGATYPDAKLKLIAGDVHRVKDEEEFEVLPAATKMALADRSQPQFKEESLFEYHLYALQRPTTIKNNQIKQIELLSAAEIPAKKLLVYDGWHNESKVNVMLEFKNSEEFGLGIPLPKGKVRVTKADSQGSRQFIGEDSIDHTPKDETVRLYLGDAFDILGERTVVGQHRPSSRSLENTVRIVLRNHKTEPVEVKVVEPLGYYSDWTIVKSTHQFTATDARTLETTVKIPANGEVTIEYTVRYSW